VPTIPYQFAETGRGFLGHLQVSESAELTTVRWKHVDLPVCHKGDDCCYACLASVPENTASFRDHRSFGFTLGTYTEFFVLEGWGDQTKNVTFFLGDVEVSLGDVTPLAQYLYGGEEISHYHPEISDLRSIRILGVPAECAEAVLLHATVELRKRFGMRFRLFSFHADFVATDDEEPEERKDGHPTIEAAERLGPFILETTPLRLLTKGLAESESASAFLQLFRVVGYFSLVPYEAEVEALRQKANLGTLEFLVALQKVIPKDEKSLLCRILGKLTDAALVGRAKQNRLIEEQTSASLCSAMYEFRNSLVHAKSDRQADIYTEALFQKDESAAHWREICEEPAVRALQQYGRRWAQQVNPVGK
jgi:hypothetical protein